MDHGLHAVQDWGGYGDYDFKVDLLSGRTEGRKEGEKTAVCMDMYSILDMPIWGLVTAKSQLHSDEKWMLRKHRDGWAGMIRGCLLLGILRTEKWEKWFLVGSQ